MNNEATMLDKLLRLLTYSRRATDARWLDRKAAAAYVCVRVDEISKMQARGLLPEPSYHFGPRSPRYDRTELDRMLGGDQSDKAASDMDRAGREAVDAIIRRARDKKKRVRSATRIS